MSAPWRGRSSKIGYEYGAGSDAGGAEALIRRSLRAYLVGELGWKEEDYEARLDVELERRIPRTLFDRLETESGWKLQGRRLLDVGAGQGAALHEALVRGADAWGVEPSGGFGHVARVRVDEAGFSPQRILRSVGERLPIPDASVDYVVSLQVLEHVDDPEQVIREIERVLKPGGRCWISCENYLAFREQHYRVAWLPLLPKPVGTAYLRARGRNPEFLREHVTYVTFPRFESILRKTRLRDVTHQRAVAKGGEPEQIERPWLQWLVRLVKRSGLPVRPVAAAYLYLSKLFRVGITAELEKGGS